MVGTTRLEMAKAQKPIVQTEGRMRFKIAILRLLDYGQQRAMTVRELAECLGERDHRKVRLMIRELIAEDHPIASSTGEPPGYYFIQSWEEVEAYNNILTARIHEVAERKRDFNRAAEQLLGEGQQLALV